MSLFGNLTESCSSVTHCQNCTSWGCIWCGDELGCHADFSPYGCVEPVACDDLLHCMRKHPQSLNYKNYEKVNIVVVIIASIVTVLIISVLWIMLYYFVNYRKRKKLIQRHRETNISLRRLIDNQHVSLFRNEHIPNILPYQVKYICIFYKLKK